MSFSPLNIFRLCSFLKYCVRQSHLKVRLILAICDYCSWSNTEEKRNCKECWEELEERQFEQHNC